MRLRWKRRRCLPLLSRKPAMRLLARPWSLSRGLLPTIRRVTRPWLRAPRQGSLHRRRPRGVSARPSPAPQQQCCPSASARASSRMRPLWAMVRTSTSRATKTATTTRVTVMRTRILAPVMVSRGRVMVSKDRVTASSRVPVMASRGRARSRETLAALDRDLLRRVAEAPAVRMETRAVGIPQPRAKERPPAER